MCPKAKQYMQFGKRTRLRQKNENIGRTRGGNIKTCMKWEWEYNGSLRITLDSESLKLATAGHYCYCEHVAVAVLCAVTLRTRGPSMLRSKLDNNFSLSNHFL